MFGTQIHIIAFVIIVIQILLLPSQVLNFLRRVKDTSRLRILLLTLVFLGYNIVSGLLPDEQYSVPIFFQNSIAYGIKIVLGIYFGNYIYEEFGISPFRYFKIKAVIEILFFVFIVFFILPYLVTKDFTYARQVFTIIPIVMAVAFMFRAFKAIKGSIKEAGNEDDERHYLFRAYAGCFGLISICFLPIVTFFGNYQDIELPVVNLGYFAMLFAFMRNHIYQSNLEYDLIVKYKLQSTKSNEKNYQNRFDGLELTNREKEVLQLILKKHSYKEIGGILFIAEKTVSKHASNIFKKAGVNNIQEIIKYFDD